MRIPLPYTINVLLTILLLIPIKFYPFRDVSCSLLCCLSIITVFANLLCKNRFDIRIYLI